MKITVYLLCSILFLLCGIKSLNAQTTSTKPQRLEIKKPKQQRVKSDSLLFPKHKINFAPHSLFSTFHPGIELGYEHLHGNRFSTEYHFSLLTSQDNEYARDTRGYIIGFELKYYRVGLKNARWYYALVIENMEKTHQADLFYAHPREDEYELRSRSDYFTRRVEVDKAFFTTTLRIGMQYHLGAHLVADAYVGVGRRHRKVTHINEPNIDETHQWRDYKSVDLQHASNRKATEHVIKFDLNVRLAWAF